MSFEHADCEWERVGRCVYCRDHGDRLYQGHLPRNDEQRAGTLVALEATGGLFDELEEKKE